MEKVEDIIKRNKLSVAVNVENDTYVCNIRHEKDVFSYSMKDSELNEHMKRFNTKHFEGEPLYELMKMKFVLNRAVFVWWKNKSIFKYIQTTKLKNKQNNETKGNHISIGHRKWRKCA